MSLSWALVATQGHELGSSHQLMFMSTHPIHDGAWCVRLYVATQGASLQGLSDPHARRSGHSVEFTRGLFQISECATQKRRDAYFTAGIERRTATHSIRTLESTPPKLLEVLAGQVRVQLKKSKAVRMEEARTRAAES
eukprot:scaffold20733_cov45-Phaeocystis_antarctica.AAC.2